MGTDALMFIMNCLGDRCPISVKLAAVECLIVLFSRNISPANASVREHLLWIPLFNDGKVQYIYNLYLKIYGASDLNALKHAQHAKELDEDYYKLLKRFSQVFYFLTFR
jgi:hypothetical protein